MLEVIEKLLILQDRDRRLAQLHAELEQVAPQRQSLKTKAAAAQNALETARQRIMHLESDRKKLELEVESKKLSIERYSNQQLQTRKNEEYRALTHEIDTCKEAITKLEDQELDLMMQSDAAQKHAAEAARSLSEANKLVEMEVGALDSRETNLRKELKALEANRADLAGAVEENVRRRYERLYKSKGGTVVVGVNHGVCGGCHMRVAAQLLVHCRAQQDIVTCQNCGRILYYSSDMDLIPVD